MAGSAMSKVAAAAALLLVLVLVVSPVVIAVDYEVGDDSGWSQGIDYTVWARGKTFRVGDTLVFKYGPTHTLDVVDEAGYDNCDGTGAQTFSDGDTKIPLNSTGPMYFICGVPGHCPSGMKLTITVQGSSPPPTTPRSPSPPPSTPSPPPSNSGSRSPPPSNSGSPSPPPSTTGSSPPPTTTAGSPPPTNSGSVSPPLSSRSPPPLSSGSPPETRAPPQNAASRGAISNAMMGVSVVLGYGVWILG